MYAGSAEAAQDRCLRGLLVQMEGHRIELRSEAFDLLGADDPTGTVPSHRLDPNILEILHSVPFRILSLRRFGRLVAAAQGRRKLAAQIRKGWNIARPIDASDASPSVPVRGYSSRPGA